MKRRIFSLGLSLTLAAGLIAPARAAQAEPARQLLPALAAVLELEPSAPLRAQTAAVSFTLASVLSGVERTPSPPQTPEVPDTLAAYQGEILRLVNAERTKAGVDPLTLNTTLCAAAQLRAQELPRSCRSHIAGLRLLMALQAQNLGTDDTAILLLRFG